jgi:hypothetical protein
MGARTNEWSYTADVKEWINEIIQKDPALGTVFGGAKVESPSRGTRKRRDLTLLNKAGVPVLTGEVKFPYSPDGCSPYADRLVQDAQKKALKAGADFFFTWNINRFVLWRTTDSGKSLQELAVKEYRIVSVRNEEDLLHPLTTRKVREEFLPVFLRYVARLLTGEEPIHYQPLDERFVARLEAALDAPISITLSEITQRYLDPKQKAFRKELDAWMRDAQGWVLSDAEPILRDNLERAAKFTCYVLVNKLVFYEALRRRYSDYLKKPQVPKRIRKGEELRQLLESLFARAKECTGNYETVFDGDFGDRLPFLSDAAVDAWRELIDEIERYDFTRLDYDIIGTIFERLISPEERHKYGQHYTRPTIVDLINAFCILSGEDRVMDPACGGGTFLVRAYARKKYLKPSLTHQELINSLYGVDISAYPVHLTTLNLATRDLIDEENYPLVARMDFFDVRPDRRLLMLPQRAEVSRLEAGGLGKATQREIFLKHGSLDAVVGNPPYLRQEDIPKDKKKAYREFVESEWPGIKLSGRSDLHVYFWPHAVKFLKPGGRFGFLTNSSWLDVKYGFRLQNWILHNFAILAIIESDCEPWFTGARVATAATILRLEPDEEKRFSNLVRFVQLRKPLSELLANDGTEPGRQQAAERLRDEILSITKNTTTDRYRVRVVPQQNLYEEGCRLWEKSAVEPEEDEECAETASSSHKDKGPYKGGKWGIYLRAPDLYFELLDKYGDRFVHLGEIAEIKRGVTSGCDDFFFPRDVSQEALSELPDAREFEKRYGVKRSDVESGRVKIVEAGDGSRHPVESKYLEPEVHSLMEIDSVSIDPKKLKRQILLVSEPKDKLKSTYVLKYIEWGERETFGDPDGNTVPERSTVASRVSGGRQWYDLTPSSRGGIIFPKLAQYRHIISLNPKRLCISSALMMVDYENYALNDALAALLNSTLVAFIKPHFCRQLGREGNIQLDVYAANELPVPDLKRATPAAIVKLRDAIQGLAKRAIGPMLEERFAEAKRYAQIQGLEDNPVELSEELRQADRRQLDDAVFELIGIEDPDERARLIERLYHEVTLFNRRVRILELQAIENKLRAGRKKRTSPKAIAEEIWDMLVGEGRAPTQKIPDDFVPAGAACDTIVLPSDGKPRVVDEGFEGIKLKMGQTAIPMRHPPQGKLAQLLVQLNISGPVTLPIEREDCDRMFETLSDYLDEWQRKLAELAGERTGDEELAKKIEKYLWRLLLENTS